MKITVTTVRRVVQVAAAVLLSAVATFPSRAQTSGDDTPSLNQTTGKISPFAVEKDNEFGVWGGSSYDSPTLIGGTRNSKLAGVVGVRYGRVFVARSWVAVEYTIDLVPVAVVSRPVASSTTGGSAPTSRSFVYGAGAAPVGFKFIFRRQDRINPFIGINSGPFYFSEPVPRPDATRFNFLSHFNAGVQVFTRPDRAITIGYDISHLSNAGVSRINPGMNANYFYVGLSIFR